MSVASSQRRPVARPHLEMTPGPDGSVGWRLVAANGRVLGVSVDYWNSSELVQSAFESLAERQDFSATIGHSGRGAGWSWRLLDSAGRSVATGPRLFERRASCTRSFENFRDTLQTFAPLADS